MASITLHLWRTAFVLSVLVVPLALNVASAEAEPAHPHRFLLGRNLRLLSAGRSLKDKVKKGDGCDPLTNNICPGLSARNGTQLLQCCKTHCRDVLSDRNNCGACRNKCTFGQLCCWGNCTAVAYDVNNCGQCGIKCKPGVRCVYGTCGYA